MTGDLDLYPSVEELAAGFADACRALSADHVAIMRKLVAVAGTPRDLADIWLRGQLLQAGYAIAVVREEQARLFDRRPSLRDRRR